MRTILIVDDDERVRSSLSRVLGATNVNATAVESGELALAEVERGVPDLVITDVRMPGMDGLELLRLLRERAPAVPVVLMTAYDDPATSTAAEQGGAVHFLVKPLDLHELRRVVERVLAGGGGS